MTQLEGQMDIFSFIENPEAPIEMPEFDKSILDGIKGLDEIMSQLPRYKVWFRKPVYSLPFPSKAKICVYVGYWHSLDGWNYKDEQIESYEYIGEYDLTNQPIRFPEKDFPYRFQCRRFCDVEYCSRICFERRGQIWDKTEHKWVRNEDGTIMCSGRRSCDKGVEGMNYLRERSNT